jgi:hypothetical protein
MANARLSLDHVVGFIERFIAGAPVELWFRWFAVGIVIETALNYRNRPSLRAYTTNLLYSAVYLAAIFVLAPSSYYLIALVRDTIGMHGLMSTIRRPPIKSLRSMPPVLEEIDQEQV